MPGPTESDAATRRVPWQEPPRHEVFAPGMVLAGRYELGATLGVGGMGSVHVALDRELGEHVALKVLSRASEAGADVLERFRREVRLARRVAHRNAVRTFDIGEHEGLHFLTMELIEGESLAALLRRERTLPTERIVEIAQQICDGLAAVHDAGIVHRDLKPSNVLVAMSGRVLVTDFGVARPSSGVDDLTQDSRMVIGTPYYMAPEQLAGDQVTPRSDLYALGLVLYEMASGRGPFDGKTGIAVAAARLHDDPVPVHHNASVPGWLASAIMACLRRDPEQRPRDAMSVRALLVPQAPVADAITRLERASDQTHASPHDGPPVVVTEPRDGFVQGLAVLPMRYRGPAEDAYLAEAITEHLVDLLSMTQGLRVPAVGATQRFADPRDPRAVGAALGIDAVVDGTVQRAGSQLRVAVRLLDARTGYQTWTGHVEGELQDVFALQDRIATRVAETLRLKLESSRWEGTVPAEAVEAYLRARLRMRSFIMGGAGPDGAATLLERCLALAPGFPPALATYATVCSRMWFFHGRGSGERSWAERGAEAMARALVAGPRLPDTHLGAARMLVEEGRVGEAVRALQRALELAPTHAAARGFLGTLQCEAGRAEEGFANIELAVELDPVQVFPLITTARHRALRGERERCDAVMQRLWREDPDTRFGMMALYLRLSLWDGDHEQLKHWRDAIATTRLERSVLLRAVADYVLGEADEAVMLAMFEQAVPPGTSPRFRALQEQCVVEGWLARGRNDIALEWLERLAAGIFIDVDWLDHCPLVARIADDSRLWTVQETVRGRVQELWTMR